MHEIDQNMRGSDPLAQGQQQEQEQKEKTDETKYETRNEGWFVLLYCLKLWSILLVKALVVVTPVLAVMWIFFIPALVLSRDLLQGVEDLLYVKVGTIFFYVSLYGFDSIYGVSIFGFYFTRKALFFCFLPGCIISILFDVFISASFGHLTYFVAIILSINNVYRKTPPENPPKKLMMMFERKNIIAKPLGKMALVLFAVYYLIVFIYPAFLNSGFVSRLFIRFIVLPIIVTCCTNLQMHFLKSVQCTYIDFLIPMLWITNGFLKIYERIFTNTIFKSGDYLSLVATTFTAALIELVM
eukprot:TRINITY_DN1784_c0_g2_i4.p1 TRINITY_DN1784_c0_g2~~TRINITY_DN1784_c0_g2_i4.p1  ORF type:complete len:298 (+),score=46.75 TRINITY_DN1784_c0_g2_i4:518-1411(+)